MSDTTQGTGTPQVPQGDDAPKYVTVEELNRAITARFTGFQSKIEKTLAESQSSLTGKLDELLKTKTPAAEEPKDKPSEKEVQFNALQAQYKELSQKFEAEQKARADAERKAREDSAYSALKQHLIAAKVRPELVDTLADSMFSGRNKRVEFDDAGNPLFKVKVAPVKGMAEEDQLFSLQDGIQAFSKSKEAESWLLPPSGAGNAPTTTPRQVAPTASGNVPATGDSEADRAAQIRAVMAQHGLSFP